MPASARSPAGRRFGEVGQDVRADQVRGRVAEQLRRPAVHAQQSKLACPNDDIGVRRFFVEIPVAALALDQLLLDPQPFELDGGAGGEDPEDEEPPRLGRHGPLVEHRQVAEHVPVAVQQRNAQVALDPQVDEILVARELLLDPWG